MKNTLFVILLFNACLSFSQNSFKIKGVVKDSILNKALISSTVYLERLKDSTMVSYSITNAKGAFEIEDFTNDSMLSFNVSYTGMQTYTKNIDISKSPIDLGTIYLAPASNQLNEVLVKADRSPIVLKKDTLEFNAASFKTREGANLEELLKKLPGLKVDAEGNITVNGKPVERILVNGKSFFGDDPKIATKNLPKSLIDKIQVVDTKTDEEEFTGEEGDQENKTINITIDEDKNKGVFSRLTLSGGTDDRYAMNGFANYFKDNTRISVIAGSNNINTPGFSFDEVYDMMGNVSSITRSSDGSFGINGMSFGGNSGITKSDNVGVSYADEWNKTQELESNYFFGSNKTRNETSTRRENILPDGNFFSNSDNNSLNTSDSHRANLNYSVKPDTLTRISIRPNINLSKGENLSASNSESLSADGDLVNQLSTQNNSTFENNSFNNTISASRRLKENGAYVSLRFSNNNSKSDNSSFFKSTTEIFGDAPTTEEQDQNILNTSQNDQYTIGATYRNKLTERLFYNIYYEYSTANEKSERLVFDFDDTTESYDDLNENLSNVFAVNSQKHIPKAGLSYNNDTLYFNFNAGLNRTELKTQNLIQETALERNFNILAYNGYFRMQLKDKSNISAWFNNSTQIPSVGQLQPVSIQTDPLNIVEGNPNLDAAIVHRFNLNYNKYNYKSRSGFGLYTSYTYNQDQVVQVVTTDEDLVRTRTYTNLSGGQQAYFNFYLNKSLKKTKNENDKEDISFGTDLNFSYNRNLGFSNAQIFTSEAYRLSPSIGITYEIEELLEINPDFGLSYNFTNYSLQEARDEEFTNFDIRLNTTTYWPKNVVWGNDITFTRLGNVSDDFENTSLLWNMSLGYTFAKDRAILKITAYDLLDQNINTRRRTGDDFIQDTNQLILTQYFMLGFTYKFSKFGGKDPNKR